MEDENKVTEVRTKQVEPGREGRITTYKATQFIWLLFGILEGLLGLRFLLKLIGANPSSPIVSLIYSITGFFLEPFKGLIASPTIGNIVLEIST